MRGQHLVVWGVAEGVKRLLRRVGWHLREDPRHVLNVASGKVVGRTGSRRGNDGLDTVRLPLCNYGPGSVEEASQGAGVFERGRHDGSGVDAPGVIDAVDGGCASGQHGRNGGEQRVCVVAAFEKPQPGVGEQRPPEQSHPYEARVVFELQRKVQHLAAGHRLSALDVGKFRLAVF